VSMKYELAQVNIARFRVPADDPVNADFVDNLDRVNAIAVQQPGFVWRLVGDGNDALDVRAGDDPLLIVNLSVWVDVKALAAFVYRNHAHLDVFRHRSEWFDPIDTHMALWWVPAGHRPDVDEAMARLDHLRTHGPSDDAFTFKQQYPSPDG